MGTPSVAVILPAYNAGQTISRAIESVLNQTYSDFNLYIVDDHSDDNTAEVIRSYEHIENVFIINHDVNKGVSEARNTGMKASSEELVSFIDSDDEWHNQKLELQVEKIRSGYNIVFTAYNYIKNSSVKFISFNDTEITLSEFIRKKFRVCFSSALIKRAENGFTFQKLGHEDFLFIHEYMNYYGSAYIIPVALCNHFIQDDSLSSQKKKAAIWHYLILKKLYPRNVFMRLYLFSNYVYQALKFKLTTGHNNV